MLKLLTEPPEALPLEVETEMRSNWRSQQRRAARGAAVLYLTWFLYLPLGLWVGLHPKWLVIAISCIFAAAVLSFLRVSRTPAGRAKTPYAPVVFTSLALGSLSVLFGPLILCPSLVLINCVGFLLQPERSRRVFVIASSSLALLVPLVLEWLGVIPPAYRFADGDWLVLPRLMRFSGPHVIAVQTVINVSLVIFIGVFFSRFRDMLSSAERRWYMHSWQLRQLIPAKTRGLTPLAPPTPAPVV